MDEKISILVVDDEPNVLYTIARTLRSVGYVVFEAVTGQECLSVVHEQKPDLVLLDVMLPDMDGYEVCRRIKVDENVRGTFIVMFSAKLTESDNQSEGLEIGADGYLIRPISNRELLARVQSIGRIITAERARDLLIAELQKALATIKTLTGLLPICSECKKIRNDDGEWEDVELYVKKFSTAEFSHGICPNCFRDLYSEYGDLLSEEDE